MSKSSHWIKTERENEIFFDFCRLRLKLLWPPWLLISPSLPFSVNDSLRFNHTEQKGQFPFFLSLIFFAFARGDGVLRSFPCSEALPTRSSRRRSCRGRRRWGATRGCGPSTWASYRTARRCTRSGRSTVSACGSPAPRAVAPPSPSYLWGGKIQKIPKRANTNRQTDGRTDRLTELLTNESLSQWTD